MRFPLKGYKHSLPREGPASFGATRKHDIHTGVDLYCEQGDPVFAIEEGIVVAVEDFTGENAESPWWNDTQAILVEGASGVVLYGEVEALVTAGDPVNEGEMLGRVQTVLKHDKGKNPPNMLHIELYAPGTTESVWWRLNEEQPEELLDVTPLLFRRVTLPIDCDAETCGRCDRHSECDDDHRWCNVFNGMIRFEGKFSGTAYFRCEFSGTTYFRCKECKDAET